MASVRITQTIRDNIKAKVNKAFESQMNLATESLSQDFGDRVYAYCFRKELQNMQALPDSFFVQDDDLPVNFKHFDYPTITKSVSLTQKRILPFYTDGWRTSRYTDCNNSRLYDELKLQQDKIEFVKNERSGVLNVVENATQSCSTLKRLLEAMPEIQSFIPEELMREHHRVPDPISRKKAEKHTINVSQENKIAIAKTRMI